MDAPLRPSPAQQRLPSLLVEAICLAALVLACVKLGRGVEGVLDLGLWDEADYLHRAQLLPVRGLPDPEWGPLYSVWYLVLARVWPDPVDLFYGNARLLILLTTVAGYVFLRRVGARPWLALAGAAAYLLSMAPHVLPRPTLLAFLVILLSLIAASRVRSAVAASALVGLGLLVASFARPEHFLSFLLMSALLAGLLARGVWKERSRWPRAVGAGAAYGLAALALMEVMGNPFGNTSNRRFYAFCQHFADNHVKRTGFPVNPWSECGTVIREVFGDGVDTLGEAARANPGAVLTHVGQNLGRYPRESLKMFAAGPGGTSPLSGSGPWKREEWGHLLLLALAVGLPLGTLVANGRRLGRALRRPRVVRVLVATCAVLLPVAASVMLIQPRQHYLVHQGLLGLGVLAALASAVTRGGGRLAERLATGPGALGLSSALACVLVLAVPDLVARQGGPSRVVRPQLQRVRELRALGLEARIRAGDTVNVLDAQGGVSVYLGAPFRRVPPWTKRAEESLTDYLRRQRIDLVLLDGRLREDPLFRGDPELDAFYAEPGAFGYATWRLRDSGEKLALPDAWATGKARRTAPSLPESHAAPAVSPRCDGALPAMESGRTADAGMRPGCARLPAPHL
ncbi:hypothetical protein HPC49_24600 [Pyxidicoccus fallax]|uniref:DUF6311 domain-containing protein n=1 Tax=Pyxidicoccus fallax TaxID=394095 RepID=A0A848LM10_9BACT|nr:hypothetical protein [Pyxidicoccus fallax]NMO18710.1 hypothetical protein [Pyxidicoccus fallax]NPC81398.1 hypothetical protein [Pyxidicoccus fallax]